MFLLADRNNLNYSQYSSLSGVPSSDSRYPNKIVRLLFHVHLSRPNFLLPGLKVLNSEQIISTFSCELLTKSIVQVYKDYSIDTAGPILAAIILDVYFVD